MAFLLTFPVRDYEVVIGKYLASLVLMILTVLGTLPLVMVVNFFGDPDMGPIIGGYLGVILLGSAYLAIGFVMSLTTKNQIIAFIMSLLVCFFAYILSMPIVILSTPDFLVGLFQGLALASHYESITKGVIDFRDIIYYISFIGFLLYLNTQLLDLRRVEKQS